MQINIKNSPLFLTAFLIFLFSGAYGQHDDTSTTIPPPYADAGDEGPPGFYDQNHEYMRHGMVPSTYTDELVMDVYGLPGMQQEFRVELLASTFQCFHQRLQKDAKFYLYFEVLRGTDKNIDFEVIRPDGVSLKGFQWTNEGVIDRNVPLDGIYTICMDNRLSRFSNKIVFLFMNSYFEADWEKLSNSLQDIVTSMANFTGSFMHLDQNVKQMLAFKSLSSQTVIKDWYLITDTNKYVQNMSILLCVVIVATSVLQVYFVRKLFTVPRTTPTSKPRA